jgi:hypothetical protein
MFIKLERMEVSIAGEVRHNETNYKGTFSLRASRWCECVCVCVCMLLSCESVGGAHACAGIEDLEVNNVLTNTLVA